MSDMWSRWARRHRLIGLGFLTGTAVAIAIAVLAFTIELAPLVGALAAFALVMVIHAGFEFHTAHKYAKAVS